MGKITISLNDELEQKLRIQLAKNGGKKGAISNILEELIEQWLQQQK